MPNPVLNDKAFARSTAVGAPAQAGWAAPDGRPIDSYRPMPAPAGDGPVSAWKADRMTMDGTVRAALVLFGILVAGGVLGWWLVPTNVDGEVTSFPGWILGAAIVALIIAVVTSFKPAIARFTGPVYALVEGVLVGAISHVYESVYDGIVVQALLGTAGVFGGMLMLYGFRVIRVTDRFRKMVVAATLGVFAVYAVGLIARLFGGELAFINSPSALGIGFTLLVVGIAAFNLMLDFDLIERGSNSGAPAHMNWYAAFGLMVTVVWLYLELLRLLAKLRDR
jgi:uncharacterized YccA/Bax inhibitor family protein